MVMKEEEPSEESDEDYKTRIEPIQTERIRLLKIFAPLPTTPCIVLDLFFGSGTTGLVTQDNGRKFIGIELSEKYCEEIVIPRLDRIIQGKLI